jgi:hypothetical protein
MKTRRTLATTLVLSAAAIFASTAAAHNAGHLLLADGTCISVGSGKDAPYVSANNPHLNTSTDPGRLDLEPGAGDQYGARFAADQAQTPIQPRWCEEIGLVSANR